MPSIKKTEFSKGLLLTVATVALTFGAGQAAAQNDDEASTQTDAEDSRRLNTIEVTARKRTENLQDVPVTISAFDTAALERNAIDSFDDLSDMTPGLISVGNGSASSQGGIALRGVQSGFIGIGIDQAVATNIDGVQIESAFALKAGLQDLRQVEILKGPQSLFFGKNSPGGVIALKTADPTDEALIEVTAGYEVEANEKYGQLVLSGPLSDTLSARGMVYYTESDGFLENIEPTGIPEMPGIEEIVLRGTLLWEPSTSFNANLKVTHADRSSNKKSLQQKILCGNPAATTSDCTLDGNIQSSLPVDVLNRYDHDAPFEDTTLTVVSLNMDYDVSDTLTLSSVTGLYEINQDFYDSLTPRAAGDTSIFGVNPADGSFLIFPNEILNEQHDALSSFSQEIRLASDFDGPLNFMIGGFYDDREVEASPRLAFGAISVPSVVQRIQSESLSGFAQVTYDISDALELAGGLRYTSETRNYTGELLEPITDPASGAVLAPTGSALNPADDQLKTNNVSPEITLSWRPNSDVTLFAAYKEGFKSGSFDMSATSNAVLAFPGGADIRFNDENVQGGEIGFKTEWHDGSLRLNGTGYFYDYTDLQLSTFDPITVSTRTLNAGAATVKGFEVDAQYSPASIEGLVTTLAFNHNRAQYDEFVTDCNQTQLTTGTCLIDLTGDGMGDSQDLAGVDLIRAPRWSGSAGFSLERTMTESLDYRLGGSVTYSGSYFTDSRHDPVGKQDSYAFLNANFGILGGEGGWEVEALLKNVTDERYLVISNNQPFTGGGPIRQDQTGIINRGREIRLQVKATF